MEKYDAYVEQLSQMRNAIDMDYMRGLWPRPDLPPPEFVQPDDPTFLNQVVTSGFSPFAYEAAIALGLSACAAVINSENVTLFLNGTLHYEEYRANEFDGISGRVALDPLTGTRLPETALYRVVNYNPVPVDPSSPDGNQKFDTLLTHVFIDSEWEARGEYIFNDGTANLPADLAPPPDGNTGMLIGVACGVTAFLLLATSLVWCLIREHKRKSNDSVWRVQKHELHFADPPEILGRGQYGLVLSAEYRGTKVAVKRAIPPKKKMKKSETSPGKIGSNVRRSLFDPESEALAGIDPSTTQGDATEDHSGTSSGPGRATVSGTHSNNGRQSGKTSWSNMGVLSDLTKSHKNSVSSEHQNYRKMREDFVEEMRYLSRLRHPCITTVMGAVMEKDEEPMLVMEFMDHGSLYDLLHNETMVLEGDVLLQILCDISQGIRFLHSAEPKVIHGDLKTANILVDTRFRAKVADFGLSQEKNMGGTGTPFWMAPELLRRESKNTDKTDVYSFGIMLYEVYARRDPYEGQPARDVLRAVADPLIRKRPPAPSHMPAALKALMADCLDDDPEKRPTFEEIDTRLRRIDAEAALSASAASNAKNSHVSLFDIFPRHVAEALRDGRKVEPEHKDVVTIFFSDIVGYTDMSARMDPSKVANMLDRLYHKFDTLSQELEIFKVETIGDAYMAVTNLVSKQTYDHAKRIAHFAIRAVAVANETLIDEDDPTKGHVNIRVGFHSGPVVADVVGNRNPRYCLFGDTVNTASRMESNSAMNRINCSEEAAKYLKEQAPEIPLKPRGMVSIKGKGEMNCFWVNEQGTAKDSALERIRAKQKLKLLQQEIDQWGGGVIAPEQAPQKDLESQQLSAVAEGASRHFNEAPSAEFKKMEISLKDRLGRGQKCETWDMQFL
jgi:serine/threonine protein kinase